LSEPLLALREVTKRFGGVTALAEVTFDVAEGEVLGVIGPNGAGKTTLLDCISGVYRPDGGAILMSGRALAGRPPHQVARLGIGRTFQIVKPFTSMTVRENAAVGALFGSSQARMPTSRAFAFADEVLELVGLAAKRNQPVASLTVPDRKRLEVARALCTRPRLLLLDEVMAGLNAVEVDEALEMTRRVHASGVTIMIIEHVMRVIVGICTRALVLHLGRVLATGEPQQVLTDRRVVEAYLGERYAQRQAGARNDG
jgi:branched-chain amino acid transport system ATP-binding protein